jgi:hypothetical protein
MMNRMSQIETQQSEFLDVIIQLILKTRKRKLKIALSTSDDIFSINSENERVKRVKIYDRTSTTTQTCKKSNKRQKHSILSMKQFIFTLRFITTISNLISDQLETKVEMSSFIDHNIVITITFTFIVFGFSDESTNDSSSLKRENDLIISTRRYLVTIIIFDFKKQMIKRTRELIFVTFSAFRKRGDSQSQNNRKKKRDRSREIDRRRDSISFST